MRTLVAAALLSFVLSGCQGGDSKVDSKVDPPKAEPDKPATALADLVAAAGASDGAKLYERMTDNARRHLHRVSTKLKERYAEVKNDPSELKYFEPSVKQSRVVDDVKKIDTLSEKDIELTILSQGKIDEWLEFRVGYVEGQVSQLLWQLKTLLPASKLVSDETKGDKSTLTLQYPQDKTPFKTKFVQQDGVWRLDAIVR